MNGFDFSTATDIRLGSTTVSAVYYGSNKIWPSSKPSHDYSQDYLTFEALESGTFTWTDTTNSNSISYSTDNGSTWTTLASGSSTPTIAANSKVLFKASGLSVGNSGIGTFSSTGSFDAMGNIMSLVYGDNFANQTTINSYQFYKLFKNSRIVDASNLILPATTLAPSCYREMFDSSELKITPKSLPATALASNCYRSMFGNCTSLITVMSILPAMTLAPDCYRFMFGGSSLTTAPELPATSLSQNCYNQMFSKCASLTTAPELPATTLAPSCYYWMFNSCTSLTTAPELPATSLAPSCYNNMFRSCTLLNNVKCLATNISASNCTYNWLYSVATSGTFIKASTMSSWPTSPSGIPSGWTIQNEAHNYANDYFTIESLESNNTITFDQRSSDNLSKMSYSTNRGATWTQMPSNGITLNDGDRVLFKASNTTIGSTNWHGIGRFLTSNNAKIEGNVMSLLVGDDFLNTTPALQASNFANLFHGDSSNYIVDAENFILPSMTLATSCYDYMFYNNIRLTKAPKLPATTLASRCYDTMFGYTAISVAPELPATTLASQCYGGMFSYCRSLTKVVLPAPTLVSSCYQYMFQGCSLLKDVTCLASTYISGTTIGWMNYIPSSGTFTKAASATNWPRNTAGIPSGWTVVDAS